MRFRFNLAILAVLAFGLSAPVGLTASAEETAIATEKPVRLRKLPGPFIGKVLRVIDGDTFDVRVHTWLDQVVETRVRLAGVNAPETSNRTCAPERLLGEQAKAFAKKLIEGQNVTLSDIRYGKWAGRVVADINGPNGKPIAASLIESGNAVVYDGTSKRGDWCSGTYVSHR
ncbi:MAG: thermonuclease family protein [Magnetovibrionaceae bacterium]